MVSKNTTKEQRRSVRKSFVVPIKIFNNSSKLSSFLSGLSRDISMVGVALESADNLVVGEQYNFEVLLSSKKKIKPIGKIAWSAKRDENTMLYGVSFASLSILDRIRLSVQLKVIDKI